MMHLYQLSGLLASTSQTFYDVLVLAKVAMEGLLKVLLEVVLLTAVL